MIVVKLRAARERKRARKEGKALGRPRKVFDRAKALRLSRQGKSIRVIADRLGVSHATVHRAVKHQGQVR